MIIILTTKDLRRTTYPWKENIRPIDTIIAAQTFMEADMVFYAQPDGVIQTIKNKWNTCNLVNFEEMRELIRDRLEKGE